MHKLNPDKWVEAFGDELYLFILKRIADEERAKDLLQDIFYSAWKNKEGFKGEASERTWLYQICKNKIIDFYRKGKNAMLTTSLNSEDDEQYFDEHGNWQKDSKPHNWGMDAGSKIETKEFYKVLEQCKEDLKKMQQAVFAMKYLDDMESEEICKVLDITPSNYWILIHRARLKMRLCMEKKWFDKY